MDSIVTTLFVNKKTLSLASRIRRSINKPLKFSVCRILPIISLLASGCGGSTNTTNLEDAVPQIMISTTNIPPVGFRIAGTQSFSAAIVTNGNQVNVSHAIGYTDEGLTSTDTDSRTDMVMSLASITKTYTAAMIFQMIDEGASIATDGTSQPLTLDTTLNQLLPKLEQYYGELGESFNNISPLCNASSNQQTTLPPTVINICGTITIRHLLNHTSGISGDVMQDPLDPNLISQLSSGSDLAAIGVMVNVIEEDSSGGYRFAYERPVHSSLDFLTKATPPADTPNSAPTFNSTNYIILGLILEAIDGKAFSDIVESRITNKLNVADTFAGYYNIPGNVDVVHNYTKAFKENRMCYANADKLLTSLMRQPISTFVDCATLNGSNYPGFSRQLFMSEDPNTPSLINPAFNPYEDFTVLLGPTTTNTDNFKYSVGSAGSIYATPSDVAIFFNTLLSGANTASGQTNIISANSRHNMLTVNPLGDIINQNRALGIRLLSIDAAVTNNIKNLLTTRESSVAPQDLAEFQRNNGIFYSESDTMWGQGVVYHDMKTGITVALVSAQLNANIALPPVVSAGLTELDKVVAERILIKAIQSLEM